jgi:hypothetical protein
MFITITSIRLRKWWGYFYLTSLAFKITLQLRKQKGFIKMKNTGFGYLHFTLSCWETEEDVKRFSRDGAHLNAMKKSSALATEVRTYTYQSDQLPKWKEAKQLLLEKGKILIWK